MSKITKYLSVLLAVCMLFGALPMTVLAGSGYSTDELLQFDKMIKTVNNSAQGKQSDTDYDFDTYADTTDTEKTNDFSKIVLLDCGRKYFTADWIKALITEMADAGYNQLTLAFGNDGLRFLLDDMSLTDIDSKYTTDYVVNKVVEGNKAQNDSGNGSYLTEDEMDAIIAHATEKGIEIVPLLNLPGHANAMLDIFDDANNASGSQNTFDITNENVQNDAYAIFTKYVDYFASKGCKFFNFGADEYANDASGTFSFSRLNPTEYAQFVSFMNKLAEYITQKGMTPRAFNDGMYYNNQSASINKNIQCCYWSSGWSSYPVASASTIAGNGHKMINTHGDFYYVLGKDDKWDSTDGTSTAYASNWDDKTFAGGSTVSNPVGSMFCIWCDYPNAETEDEIKTNVFPILEAMAKQMTAVYYEDNDTPDTEVTVDTYELASSLVSGEKYLIVYEGNALANDNGSVANIPGVTTSGDYAYLPSGTDKDTVLWTYTTKTSGIKWNSSTYYYLSNNSQYISPTRSGHSNKYTYSLGLDSSETNLSISGSNGKYTVRNSSKNSYVVFNDSKWGADENSQTYLSFYKYSTSTGIKITINYVLDGTTVKSEDMVVAKGTSSVTLSGFNANGKYYTPSDGATLTLVDGQSKYSVNVTETDEDLTGVSPLKIEYWITNAKVTGTTSNLQTAAISAKSAHCADGVAVSDLVDSFASNGRTLEYWKCNLLDTTKTNSSTSGTEEQTGEQGDDETLSGSTFTHVRYWSGKWSVKTTDGEWVDVATTHQLVAYYLEVVDIADEQGNSELHVNAADWGKKGDGSSGTDYLKVSSSVSISFQVIYEDGTTNPASVEATDLKSKTVVYNLFDGLSKRGIGTVLFNGGGDFKIWKIEAETGEHTISSSSSRNEDNDPVTITEFKWDNNPMTVFENAENPRESISIANNARNPLSEGFYENLMWDEKKEAILIKVYVKTVETKNSLTVIYQDQNFNAELYKYYIDVPANNNFNNSIVKDNEGATPPAFNGSSTRIDVTGYGIVNSKNVTQYFETNLTEVPQAVGKYNSDLYTYTGSEIKDDGKTLYLYYTIDTNVLSPHYVIDFGLPITFPLTAILSSGDTVSATTVIKFSDTTGQGTLTYDENSHEFTYTPTKILQKPAILSIQLTVAGTTNATNVGVTPATTVYYEEGFINWDNDEDKKWSVDTQFTATQTTEKLGRHTNYYGYDPAYDVTTASDTSASSSTVGSSGTFTFTGNGVQVFANCTDGESNRVVVEVRNSDGKLVAWNSVDTNVAAGTTDATSGQTGDMNGLPIVSLVNMTNLTYGTYTVKITKIVDTETVNIDGIRIFNTIEDSTIFTEDKEDNPNFYELRDAVLHKLNVLKENSNDYKQNLYEQVYNATKGATIIITEESIEYANDSNLTDLLDNGPKNELFLYKDQILTFKVKTDRVMQLGLKAPQGATGVEITVKENGGDAKTLSTNKINSSVDMFYVLNDTPTETEETTYTVSVKNTGENLLSVTLLKICDDPSAAFVPFSAKDIAEMVGYDGYDEDQLPTDIEAWAYLPISVKGADGETLGQTTISHFGKVGDTHTFTADEIESALSLILPDGYVLSDTATYTDVEVKYGESAMGVTFLASPDVELPDDDDDDFGFDYDAWFAQMMYLQSIRNNQKKNNTVNDTTKEEPEITEPEQETPEVKPVEETTVNPFADVAETDWFFEDVAYAYENGLMIGTSDTEFSPNAIVNRAMLVTILWRLEGSPAPTNTDVFTDVPNDEWYTDAVNWAAEIGIVNGYGDGAFGPLDDLTREQIMAILNRYADYKGWTDGILVPMLPQYTYSAWSENNTIWADMCGLLNGIGKDVSDLTLAADRAEMAAYLRRFRENIAK